MNITDLPNGLKELAEKRRSESTWNYKTEDCISWAFDWDKTDEGKYFWSEISAGNLDEYKECYAEHSWTINYPDEYQIVADAYGNTIVAKVGDYVESPFDAASAGTKFHKEMEGLIITPAVLANGYYAGEDQIPEVYEAWAKGYEYAMKNLNLSDIMYTPSDSLSKNPPDAVFVETTGIKDGDGKIDYSEINFSILDLMAARFTDNKHKYPKGNMLKPIDIDSLLWPIFRHWKKMKFPLKDDPETFSDHLSAIMCNCSMVLDQLKLKQNK